MSDDLAASMRTAASGRRGANPRLIALQAMPSVRARPAFARHATGSGDGSARASAFRGLTFFVA
jgi:hypothetical protein